MADTKTVIVARLTPSMLADLEKRLPPPVVDERTTDLQAGYRLGIQHVIKLLREGYTIQQE